MKYDRFLRSVTERTRAEQAARGPAKVDDVLASSLAGEAMLASVARPTVKRSHRSRMNLKSKEVLSRDAVEHGRTE